MNQRKVILKAALVLVLVWASVWALRSYAGSRKITAERLQQEMENANFADWSDTETDAESAEGKRRIKVIGRISRMVNQLDFQEREKNRRDRSGEKFFRKLSSNERALFIDLTVTESMNRFMESLDSMPPEQRRKFVEQGLKEIEQGRTEEELARTEELGGGLLEKISEEGMRAYFENSSTQTKLDLAPLMEAVNETMQGMRGNKLNPRRQQ